MKGKQSEHKIPNNFLIEWTAQAKNHKQSGMLILFNPKNHCYFPRYAMSNYGLWDTAVLLEREGYEVIEFHVFKDDNDKEKEETIGKNNQ